MSDSLLDAINLMVDGSNKTIKAIAEEVGKPYGTLKRELNEYDELAKLGADLLYPLMRSCDSVAPLRHLAGRMGYALKSLQAVTPDKATFFEELCDDMQAVADFQKAMCDDEDIEIVQQKLAKAKQELDEDFVAWVNK